MEIDELSQSQALMVTSQDTRIAGSTDTRLSPAQPLGLSWTLLSRPDEVVPVPTISHSGGTYINLRNI